MKYPRQESNLRTRVRNPLLYPLSYGGGSSERVSVIVRDAFVQARSSFYYRCSIH